MFSVEVRGPVADLAGLTVRDDAGKSVKVRVQGKKQQGIALADGTLLAAPVEVTVRAEFPASGLKPGQVVRFRCRMDQTGKADGAVAEVTALDGGDVMLGVTDAEIAPPAEPKRPRAGSRPSSGRLFLRCTDAWTELGDNDGEISVTIRRAP